MPRALSALLLLLSFLGTLRAQLPVPSEAEVQAQLQREPVTEATWPAWRQRLLDWIDSKSHNTDAVYDAACRFARDAADRQGGQLAGSLANDALAWYFLGRSFEFELRPGPELAGKAAQAEA